MHFLWIIFCVIAGVLGDGCIPTDRNVWLDSKDNITALPENRYYCEGLNTNTGGWSGDVDNENWESDSTWVWITLIGGAKCYTGGNTNNDCGCTARDIRGFCACSMGEASLGDQTTSSLGLFHQRYNKYAKYCYNTKTTCKICSPTQYRTGCGCYPDLEREPRTVEIKVNPLRDGINRHVYHFDCSPGICQDCPEGYYCNGWTKTRCPIGSYAKDNKCVVCTCPFGSKFTDKDNNQCQDGKAPSCVQCNGACEASSVEYTCPSRDYDYRLDKKGICTSCQNVDCFNSNKFFIGNSDNGFCYLREDDQTIFDRCALLYANKAKIREPSATEVAYQESIQIADIVSVNENIQATNLNASYFMPWEPGYQRVMPISPMARTGPNAQGRRGHIPYYMRCPSYTDDNTLVFLSKYPTEDMDSRRVSFLNSIYYAQNINNFMFDCSAEYAKKCAQGITKYTDDVRMGGYTFRKFLYCDNECKAPSTWDAATSKCTCGANNLIPRNNLENQYPSTDQFPILFAKDQVCLNCAESPSFFFMKEVNQPLILEAYQCKNNIFSFPSDPYQYLDVSTATFVACTSGNIPTIGRTQCMECGPGKQITSIFKNATVVDEPRYNRLQCADCPSGKYQSAVATTSCLEKRTSCNPNYRVELTSSVVEDNKCTPCGTDTCSQRGQIALFSDTAGLNTCSGSGQNYFGCMAPTIPFTIQVDYRYIFSGEYINLEKCDLALIPEHSYWVEYYKRDYAKQCYFACLHGVNETAYREVGVIMDTYYRQNPTFHQFRPGNDTLTCPVNSKFSEFPKMKRTINDPIWSWTEQREISSFRCSSYIVENTFLYVRTLLESREHAQTFQNLCVRPENAYDQNCGDSTLTQEHEYATKYTFNPSLPQIRCAWDARNNTRNYLDGDTDGTKFVVLKNNKAVCEIENTSTPMRSFRVFCPISRIEEMRRLAQKNFDGSVFYSDKYHLSSAMVFMLSHNTWFAEKMMNPYLFQGDVVRCVDSISVSTDDFEFMRTSWPVKACFPKTGEYADYFEDLCKSKGGSHNFIASRMQAASTFGEVCTTEAVTCANVNMGGLTILPISPQSLNTNTWSNGRLNDNQDSSLWQGIQCKYSCPVGYYSNPNPRAYLSTPCLRCADVDPCQGRTGSNYVDMQSCGISSNYHFQRFSCIGCPSRKLTYDIIPIAGTFQSQGECRAKCPDAYLTFDQTRGVRVSETTFSSIHCQNCATQSKYACTDTCPAGTYKDQNECIACDASSCLTNYYRTACPQGSTGPSSCEKCSEQNEYNKYSTSAYAFPSSAAFAIKNSFSLAVFNTKNYKTKQYVPYSPKSPAMYASGVPAANGSLRQCILACKNNHAWIDVRTLLSPFSYPSKMLVEYSHDHHFCIPCASPFFTGLTTNAPTLYSIWNNVSWIKQNVSFSSNGGALWSMHEKPLDGFCYHCDLCTETADDSTSMCTLKPGCSTRAQSQTTTTLNTTAFAANRGVVSSIPTSGCARGRCRRLLQQDGVFPAKALGRTINVNRIPYFDVNRGYVRCCDFLPSSLQREQCKRGLLRDQHKGIDRWCPVNTSKTSGARRRLLQEEEDADPTYDFIPDHPFFCPAGTYKNLSGDDTSCVPCPSGASTVYPYTGMTSVESCTCQRGYNMTSPHPNLKCDPCPFNSSYEINSTCKLCPPNSNSPIQGSSRCYCRNGFYETTFELSEPTCAPCPENSYCSNGYITPCPPFSASPSRSSARGHCKCLNATHFGDLAVFPQCFMNQFGKKCELTSCECEEGLITYRDEQNRLACLANCSDGFFIEQYENGTFSPCRPCPLGTYASKTFKRGESSCIPCPPQTTTLSVGAHNISQCTCSISNTSAAACECKQGFYLNASTCVPCPNVLTTKSSGATSVFQCEYCPRGHEVIVDSLTQSKVCQKCQIGKYSGSISKTCSLCLRGKTTLEVGATSNIECVNGW